MENAQKSERDGSTLSIEYGTFQYFITITVWNPQETGGEVEKVNRIAVKIYEKAGVIQWYE